MNGALFGIGLLSLLVGALFLYLGYNQNVSADTKFGKFSGGVGGVAVIFGITLMALSVVT